MCQSNAHLHAFVPPQKYSCKQFRGPGIQLTYVETGRLKQYGTDTAIPS